MKTRIEVRTKARKIRGLMNLLTDDVYHLNVDAEDYDLTCLPESIKDVRDTLQMLTDEIVELEYMLYLNESKHSRNLQSPL